MPEGSKDATVLIAISWQALQRALDGGENTQLCDCTIVLLFAAFYIEANINYIIQESRKSGEMKSFLGKEFPGLQDKLGWFYNEFIARKKSKDKKQLYNMGIKNKLKRKFPGFDEIYKFRNDISHGYINHKIANIENTKILRSQSKDIADQLFEIIAKAGHEIQRNTTYNQAIEQLESIIS